MICQSLKRGNAVTRVNARKTCERCFLAASHCLAISGRLGSRRSIKSLRSDPIIRSGNVIVLCASSAIVFPRCKKIRPIVKDYRSSLFDRIDCPLKPAFRFLRESFPDTLDSKSRTRKYKVDLAIDELARPSGRNNGLKFTRCLPSRLQHRSVSSLRGRLRSTRSRAPSGYDPATRLVITCSRDAIVNNVRCIRPGRKSFAVDSVKITGVRAWLAHARERQQNPPRPIIPVRSDPAWSSAATLFIATERSRLPHSIVP